MSHVLRCLLLWDSWRSAVPLAAPNTSRGDYTVTCSNQRSLLYRARKYLTLDCSLKCIHCNTHCVAWWLCTLTLVVRPGDCTLQHSACGWGLSTLTLGVWLRTAHFNARCVGWGLSTLTLGVWLRTVHFNTRRVAWGLSTLTVGVWLEDCPL